MRSSKPFAAKMSRSQPEALCPFHVGRVGVKVFSRRSLRPKAVSLLFLNDRGMPCDLSHGLRKHRPLRMSSRVMAFDVAIGSLW